MEIGSVTNHNSIPTDIGTSIAASRSPDQISNERELIKAVKALNGSEVFGKDSEMTFVFDRESRRALVRIVNKQTREVVMQIPPEYVIRMAEDRQRGY